MLIEKLLDKALAAGPLARSQVDDIVLPGFECGVNGVLPNLINVQA